MGSASAAALRWPRRAVSGVRALVSEPAPDTRFVIFGSGRSGSSLLVDLLDQHPELTCQGEILAHLPRAPSVRVTIAARRAAERGARVHGFKLLGFQRQALDARSHRRRGLLERLCGRGWTLVHLERRDLLRRALSNMAARRAGRHQVPADGERHRPFRVDSEELRSELRWFERQLEADHAALGSLPRLELLYEDDLLFPADQQRTATWLFESFGLDPVTTEARTAKMSPLALDELVTNIDEMRAALIGTHWEGLAEG